MNIQTRTTPPGIGHNRAPLEEFYKDLNEGLPEYLTEGNADITERVAELEAAFSRMPEIIEDEETAGNVAEQIAQFTAEIKAAEAKRNALKAGPLTAGRMIDGFFNVHVFAKIGHPKDGGGIKAAALARLTVWEKRKADEQRRIREEAERKAREAAEAAARAAAEERRRLEEAMRAEEERAAAEAARLAREADEARGLDDLLAEASAQMQAEESAAKRRAEQEAAVRAAAEEAERKRQEAEGAARAAAASAAKLSTVRGVYGASSSLRTTWKARVTDIGAVDLNLLKGFFGQDDIAKAANAYARIHKNSKPVRGIEFYEDSGAVVRG